MLFNPNFFSNHPPPNDGMKNENIHRVLFQNIRDMISVQKLFCPVGELGWGMVVAVEYTDNNSAEG